MTDEPHAIVDLTPIQIAMLTTLGDCTGCHVAALVQLLAFAIVAGTYPEKPHKLVGLAARDLGKAIAAATEVRSRMERETCVGTA